MQGLYIDTRRPKSKKEVREMLANDPKRVSLEATSWFGNEYQGDVRGMPEGVEILFVGPNPHSDRRFYGGITRKGETFRIR
jgi:hypothetical protein